MPKGTTNCTVAKKVACTLPSTVPPFVRCGSVLLESVSVSVSVPVSGSVSVSLSVSVSVLDHC